MMLFFSILNLILFLMIEQKYWDINKGKDSKYNDLNSILKNYYDNSISKLEN